MKTIGIDLDNTIVQYDQVIYDCAVQRGFIPAQTPPNKTIIRDILRSLGREADWTDIQGYVYGEGMKYARPFPGIIPFLKSLSSCGFYPCIISHRTQYPYSGGDTNLHQTAMDWLVQKRITGFPDAPIPGCRIFFECTKEKKYERIKTEMCHFFIDDLIEFLIGDLFPLDVIRVLFDPFDNYPDNPEYLRMRSWDVALQVFQRA
ncbi:hypothetical protein [Methanospirillum sp.]|uniref:hypothetical protein n=1 Tax=Methanospirillum sp. TaxID=45200 RepID=UPI00359F9EDB